MSYIGIPPQANFSSGLLDRFTSTTGTTVTLTHDIASENDIVVFVNFVKQDSTTYSVGGTGNKTLTLGGTLVSSDIVEVHYLNIVGQTNAPSSGSVGSSQISADVITGQTALAVAPDSTDELLISDAGTLKRIDVSLVGGNNTPAFKVKNSSNQSLSNSTNTKLTFDTEVFDSDNAFASNKFTAPSAAKYFISCQVSLQGSNDVRTMRSYVYKNGSLQYDLQTRLTFSTNVLDAGSSVVFSANGILNLSASDYLELYVFIYNTAGGTYQAMSNECIFQGFKLIGV